jgi:hypothetical protein
LNGLEDPGDGVVHDGGVKLVATGTDILVSFSSVHERSFELLTELHHAFVCVVLDFPRLSLDFGNPFHNVIFVEVE